MSYLLVKMSRLGLPFVMDWVKNYYPKLKEKYPLGSGFDQLYIDEMKKAGWVDIRYWDNGKDSAGKVAQAAAQVLTSASFLPVHGSGAEKTYARDTLNELMQRVFVSSDTNLSQLDQAYGKYQDAWSMGHAALQRSSGTGQSKILSRYLSRIRTQPAEFALPSLKLGDWAMNAEDEKLLVEVFTKQLPNAWSNNDDFRKGLVDWVAKLGKAESDTNGSCTRSMVSGATNSFVRTGRKLG